MDINQIYTGDSSHRDMRGPFPASSSDPRIILTPQNDFRTAGSNFNLRETFDLGYPSPSQRAPFFEDRNYTNTHSKMGVLIEPPRRQFMMQPTLRGSATAEALHRHQIEREVRRDSGIAFSASAAAPTANVFDIPMSMATRIEPQSTKPQVNESQFQAQVQKRQNTILSVRNDSQAPEMPPRSRLRLQNKNLSINTDRSRSNSPCTGLKGNGILDSFTATSSLNQSTRQSSRGRNIDDTALLFQEIEDQDEETQKKILEGHLDKIFKIVPPRLSESPARSVKAATLEEIRAEDSQRAQFRDVEAEKETEEFLKGESSLRRRTMDRVRSLWRKSWPRQQI